MKAIILLLSVFISLSTFAKDGYGTSDSKNCDSIILNGQLLTDHFNSLIPLQTKENVYIEMCMIGGVFKGCVWETWDTIHSSYNLFDIWKPELDSLQKQAQIKAGLDGRVNFEICLGKK